MPLGTEEACKEGDRKQPQLSHDGGALLQILFFFIMRLPCLLLVSFIYDLHAFPQG